ncbi:hypothetical protein BSPLISOX_149 [uncultured Gammaproteobacteria bacterium]|nr:hypothetical protein BSPLISOX_149 [uncultured Gammaproteobacteria bacterium]
MRADALQPADTKGYRLATGALKKAEMKMTVCPQTHTPHSQTPRCQFGWRLK